MAIRKAVEGFFLSALIAGALTVPREAQADNPTLFTAAETTNTPLKDIEKMQHHFESSLKLLEQENLEGEKETHLFEIRRWETNGTKPVQEVVECGAWDLASISGTLTIHQRYGSMRSETSIPGTNQTESKLLIFERMVVTRSTETPEIGLKQTATGFGGTEEDAVRTALHEVTLQANIELETDYAAGREGDKSLLVDGTVRKTDVTLSNVQLRVVPREKGFEAVITATVTPAYAN